MEHVEDVVGLDLGFFLVSGQPAHATSKQCIKACAGGFDDVERPGSKTVGQRQGFAAGSFHGLSEDTSVLFEFDLGVPNHRSRQPFFQRHPDAVREVVGLIDDDDDVLKREVHRLETGFTDAVVKEVIVVTHEDIGAAHGFTCGFPRAGLGGFSVHRVGATDVDQFVNVERAGENALLEARCGGDPRLAGTGFSGLTAQQRENQG